MKNDTTIDELSMYECSEEGCERKGRFSVIDHHHKTVTQLCVKHLVLLMSKQLLTLSLKRVEDIDVEVEGLNFDT